MTDLSDLPIDANVVLDYLYLYAPLTHRKLSAGIRALHGPADFPAFEVEVIIRAVEEQGWAQRRADGRWELTEAGRRAIGK
jgi:hypothetical protein